jgi:hypothetical protein
LTCHGESLTLAQGVADTDPLGIVVFENQIHGVPLLLERVP